MGEFPSDENQPVDGPGDCEERIALRNVLSEVARFSERLAQLAEAGHLGKKQLFAVTLCADEAITNIISYAFADDGEHRIDVLVRFMPGEVRVEIVDDGRPFDPLTVPSPQVPSDVANAAIGGRGIHLMRSFSDRLHYERVDGRNRLTISVTRDRASAARR
jgi:anti-sigma regulatory factor (Ser/Thr protein kinase)